jgi:hypothetical protein
MDHEQKIEQEVQKTLAQFERAERLRPGPFFHTRIEARLREMDEAGSWIPVFGILKSALLVLLVACNVATAAVLLRSGDSGETDRTDVVDAVGRELGLDSHGATMFLIE